MNASTKNGNELSVKELMNMHHDLINMHKETLNIVKNQVETVNSIKYLRQTLKIYCLIN
jgi:hypothetical protein